jgi:hypothetical protein
MAAAATPAASTGMQMHTAQGIIKLKLRADAAPETVKYITQCVDSGLYNGVSRAAQAAELHSYVFFAGRALGSYVIMSVGANAAAVLPLRFCDSMWAARKLRDQPVWGSQSERDTQSSEADKWAWDVCHSPLGCTGLWQHGVLHQSQAQLAPGRCVWCACYFPTSAPLPQRVIALHYDCKAVHTIAGILRVRRGGRRCFLHRGGQNRGGCKSGQPHEDRAHHPAVRGASGSMVTTLRNYAVTCVHVLIWGSYDDESGCGTQARSNRRPHQLSILFEFVLRALGSQLCLGSVSARDCVVTYPQCCHAIR